MPIEAEALGAGAPVCESKSVYISESDAVWLSGTCPPTFWWPGRAGGRGKNLQCRVSIPISLTAVQDLTASCERPRSFFPHHLTAISSAIVLEEALTLLNHGSTLSFDLTLSSLAPNTPAGPHAGGRRA